MFVIGFLYYAGVVLSAILGSAPSSGEAYLNALSGHGGAPQLNFLVWIVADLLMIPATFALYPGCFPASCPTIGNSRGNRGNSRQFLRLGADIVSANDTEPSYVRNMVNICRNETFQT